MFQNPEHFAESCILGFKMQNPVFRFILQVTGLSYSFQVYLLTVKSVKNLSLDFQLTLGLLLHILMQLSGKHFMIGDA